MAASFRNNGVQHCKGQKNDPLPNFIKFNDGFHVKVEKLLGKGTYGQVLSVRRYENEYIYAMKVLTHNDFVQKKFAEWEEMVGKLIRNTGYTEYLLAVHCSLRRGDYTYLIMDKLETDLWRFMSEVYGNRPLSVLQMRNIATQILTATETLHRLGIIHSDIKPENVLVVSLADEMIRVKLADYGTSMRLGLYNSAPIVQSLFYRAPEVLFGLPFNEKIDIWSIGCVMIEMFLGSPFYPAIDENQLSRYITEVQGYPYDLQFSKYWNNYFDPKVQTVVRGTHVHQEVGFYLKHPANRVEDRRIQKFTKIDAILSEGLTFRSNGYVSTLDVQFVKDVQLLMCVDHDWRCTAAEAKSLAFFHMESECAYERYANTSQFRFYNPTCLIPSTITPVL